MMTAGYFENRRFDLNASKGEIYDLRIYAENIIGKGNRSFRLQVVSPTSRSFRLHDRSRFAYTIWVDSPTLKSIRLHSY